VTLLGAPGSACEHGGSAEALGPKDLAMKTLSLESGAEDAAEDADGGVDGTDDSDAEAGYHARVVAMYGATTVLISPTIPFALGSTKIPKEAETTLSAVAEALRAYADWRVEIQGHADAGERAAAKRLSLERARRVLAALKALGVDPARLSAVGYGTERPVDAPDSGGHFNPPVSFRVLDSGAMP
jgi:outer membrane protein OmpA-like peptidoglycan-associated protein